jgi:Zn-dependent M28 family amino/carboxypeptidase
MLVIRDRAAAPMILRGGIDLAEIRRTQTDTILQAIPLGDAVVHVKLRVRSVLHQNPSNVITVLAGTDPVLRNEYVVYSAHIDHLGVGTPVSGDSIYNGADDNASGTAAVLAVAKAFTHLAHPPRRSVMFVLYSGEETMGWGSTFFLNHPPVPICALVADLNADMVGRNWRDTVIVIGRRDSDLGQAVDRVLASFPDLGLAVTDSSTRPNDVPIATLYGWSDHGAFIRRGIPFLYFYSGMHPDYHRPSDSADKIDVEKLARISRLMFYVGLEVANENRRPQWDPDRYSRLVSPR